MPPSTGIKTRDVSRRFGSQEGDHGSELIRIAVTPDGHVGQRFPLDVRRMAVLALGAGVIEFGDARRGEAAGKHAVDRDAVRADPAARGLDPGGQRAPADVAEGQRRDRLADAPRQDGHDPSPVLLAHAGKQGVGQLDGRDRQELVRRVELLGGGLGRVGWRRPAGVEHQDVDVAERVQGTAGDALRGVGPARVGDEGLHAAAGRSCQISGCCGEAGPVRAQIRRSQPSAASRRAQARPSPELPPPTTATRPAIRGPRSPLSQGRAWCGHGWCGRRDSNPHALSGTGS